MPREYPSREEAAGCPSPSLLTGCCRESGEDGEDAATGGSVSGEDGGRIEEKHRIDQAGTQNRPEKGRASQLSWHFSISIRILPLLRSSYVTVSHNQLIKVESAALSVPIHVAPVQISLSFMEATG